MTATLSTAELVLRARAVGLLTDATADLPDDPDACAAALIASGHLTDFQAAALLAGSPALLLGPYLLLRPLGEGGMGRVYLARHTDLGRRVAIKVLNAAEAADPLSVERFHREARAAAALDHPNIVRLYDSRRDGDTEYLVMEAVDGTDLQRLLAVGGPLPVPAAAEYGRQAAVGLGQAHARGIVHRDVKPANLMLTTDGVVKVLDLGLARSLSDPADALTNPDRDGGISGTVDYLSPEQATGGKLDRRADIYALGATLAALVTGGPPYSGTVAQKLLQHQLAPPPDLHRETGGRVPKGFARVVARMMAKRPADRPATAAEVARLLAPWANAGGACDLTPLPEARTLSLADTDAATVRLPVAASVPEPPRRQRRKPLALAGAAVLALALTVAVAWAAGFFASPSVAVSPPESFETLPTVYRLDLRGVPPFDGTATCTDKADDEFPPPLGDWYRNVWRPGCVARYRVETVDGGPALGFSADGDGAQLAFRLPADTLRGWPAGRGLRVTVEMKVEGDTVGYFAAKVMTTNRILENVLVPPGEWARRTFDIPNPRANFELAIGGAAQLWVRRLDIETVPFAPPSGDVIYTTNFREMGAFRRRVVGEETVTTHQLPALRPAGWMIGCSNPNGRGEFAGEPGESDAVLSVAAANQIGAQWVFLPRAVAPEMVEANGRYRATLEYSGGCPGTFTAAEVDVWQNLGAAALPPAAEWTTATVAFTAPPARPVQFVIRPVAAVGEPIRFRRFWIERLPPVRADAKPVYEFRASTFAGVAYRAAGRDRVTEPATGELPGGWQFESYQAGDVSELAGGTDGDRPHVALRNRTGTTAQLSGTRPDPVLKANAPYRVTVEYRAAGATGSIDLRERSVTNWSDAPFYCALPDTSGKWETRYFEITPPRDWAAVPVFQNLSDGDGNEFAVRRFAITPVPTR